MFLSNFKFEKRDLDWWFFTLLPILLTIVIGIFLFFENGIEKIYSIFFLLNQQLLSYSIVICSTDIGLKSKSKSKKQISPPLGIIIISAMFLVYSLLRVNEVATSISYSIVYFLLGISMTYFSVLLYNNNPNSIMYDSDLLLKQKQDQEQEAKESFDSPKHDSKIKVKWGE